MSPSAHCLSPPSRPAHEFTLPSSPDARMIPGAKWPSRWPRVKTREAGIERASDTGGTLASRLAPMHTGEHFRCTQRSLPRPTSFESDTFNFRAYMHHHALKKKTDRTSRQTHSAPTHRCRHVQNRIRRRQTCWGRVKAGLQVGQPRTDGGPGIHPYVLATTCWL